MPPTHKNYFSTSTIGLIRVIDAVSSNETSHTNNNNNNDPQRIVEFPEADFSSVTAEELLEAALSTLHSEKQNLGSDQQQGEWCVIPSLCVSAAAVDSSSIYNTSHADNNNNSNNDGGAFFLPLKASLLASGIAPSSGIACEIYLVGEWRSLAVGSSKNTRNLFPPRNNNNPGIYSSDSELDTNTSFATTPNAYSTTKYNQNDDQSNKNEQQQQQLFHPTKVLVTLWNVADKPSYEIDLRKPLSEITLGKFKRVIQKFSGIRENEMELLVDGNLVVENSKNTKNNNDDDNVQNKKVFPFVFDPTIVPNVLVRTKDPSNHVSNNDNRKNADSLNYYFSPSKAQTTQSKIEAEYSTTNKRSYFTTTGSNINNVAAHQSETYNNNSSNIRSPLPKSHGGNTDLKQVAPENAKDWDAWFAARRQAREYHVRNQLAPSSREQLEVERALQVKSLDDVRQVTRNASHELASSSQILHQQLENVRSKIMREKLGDQSFAKIEGTRGLLVSPYTSTSVATDGVDREPLVVNFR